LATNKRCFTEHLLAVQIDARFVTGRKARVRAVGVLPSCSRSGVQDAAIAAVVVTMFSRAFNVVRYFDITLAKPLAAKAGNRCREIPDIKNVQIFIFAVICG
jgi:hypothetical protein